MIRNLFKSSLRTFWKNRSTSLINLVGLSVGMTAAVFIFIWVQNEFNFDQYQPDKEQIFRITNAISVSKNEEWIWESSPLLLASEAEKQIPEVLETARFMANSWGGFIIHIDGEPIEEDASAWVDPTWFRIFKYDFLEGSPATFASTPFSAAITKTKALQYFGTMSAVGRTLQIDSAIYSVKAVLADNPVNSSFQQSVLLNVDGHLSDPATLKNERQWGNFNYLCFLKIRPTADLSAVTEKINKIIDDNRPNDNCQASLQPLTGMYLESDLQSSSLPHGNKKTAFIFSMLGILLLLTACINYVNLTTAKASLRAKEVSVRKIVGASKGSLFLQFMADSFTICGFALLISIGLIKLLLPVFNQLTEKQFNISLTNGMIWQVLLGTLLAAVLLNGIYPAALLSSFRPINVFRGRSVLRFRDGAIRKSLVIFQFSLSVILIVGTLVIFRQLSYVQKMNPGYTVSQIMSLEIPYSVFKSKSTEESNSFFNMLKNEFGKEPGIVAVSSGGAEIVNVGNTSAGNANWDGKDSAYNPTFNVLTVDPTFSSIFQLQLAEGKWFDVGTDNRHKYILNETAATTLGIPKPVLGQRFIWGGDTGTVTGIVKDFHYRSMHQKIGPLVMRPASGWNSYLFLKTAAGQIPTAIAATEKTWNKLIPDLPFSYTFMDDSFQRLYKNDIRTSTLILIFSIIAIIISSLGLFALAAFTAERKTKEIGIRKVLGATVFQITNLISGEFLRLVIIAILIAVPISVWLMTKWLEEFAYRIPLSAVYFLVAAIVALVVAFLAVSFQAIRAATANPTSSLRETQ